MDFTNDRLAQIHRRFSSIEFSVLDIIDESHLHVSHTGKGTGSHFKIIIKANILEGKTRLQQHRLLYALITDLIPHEIHAVQFVIIN